MIMMNCYVQTVEPQKTLSLIFSRTQSFSPSQISNTPQAEFRICLMKFYSGDKNYTTFILTTSLQLR